MNTENFLKRRQVILNGSSLIQIDKSSDYGTDNDPFIAFRVSEIAGITPEQAILSRVCDKISRLGNIVQNKEMKVKEKSLDTVIDLINYALILQCYLESKK